MRVPSPDDCVRADIHHRADVDVLADDCGGMDSRLEFCGGIETIEGSCKCGARLGHADHGAIAGTRPLHGYDAGSRPRSSPIAPPPLRLPTNATSDAAGRFERCYARQFLFAVAFKSRAQPVC